MFSIVGGASPNSKYSENPVVMHWKSCAAISVFTTKRIMNSKIYCIIRTVKVIHPFARTFTFPGPIPADFEREAAYAIHWSPANGRALDMDYSFEMFLLSVGHVFNSAD